MSSNKRDEMDLPLALTLRPPRLPVDVINGIGHILEKMRSILEENPDGSIRKYTIDTLNDATTVYLRDVYNHHDYPLPPWMIQTQEQTAKNINHDNDNDQFGNDSELETPTRNSKRRVSFSPVQRVENGHPSPEGKSSIGLSTRKAKMAKAHLEKQLEEGSLDPVDALVKLLVPITTVRTLDQEQERLILLYFKLINFTKVIKIQNRDQSYTLPSDYAIEIVNFFIGTVFHSSGATMVDLAAKEWSKTDDWKGFESPPRLSRFVTTHEVIRQFHIVHKAEEFISEKWKKIPSPHAPVLRNADLVAYMKDEGFGPAKGVRLKSRFHSMIAKQFKIDSKTIPKKVRGGLFLYHLVLSFGSGVLFLLQDNALTLWTEVIPKGLIPEILTLVSGDFPELIEICQGLEYKVSNKIKMGVVPTMTFNYDAQSFANIFVVAGISSVEEAVMAFQKAMEADPSGRMAELLNWARWTDPGSTTTMEEDMAAFLSGKPPKYATKGLDGPRVSISNTASSATTPQRVHQRRSTGSVGQHNDYPIDGNDSDAMVE
ncbi:hypothetical protein VE03_03271 [Pseudogymnoascus sp. 23342-1-I1]|nr:hypothetical protein VE03_03271 [Pseudogymnoascus sp. 23342-1-I1]